MAPVHIMLTGRCQREIPVAFMTSLTPTGELSRALRGRWWESCIIFWIGVKAGAGPLASVYMYDYLYYYFSFRAGAPLMFPHLSVYVFHSLLFEYIFPEAYMLLSEFLNNMGL